MSAGVVGRWPQPSAGDGCAKLLEKLNREEILEILSEGFCQNCEALLEKRIRNIISKNVSEADLSNSRDVGSTLSLAADANGNPSYSDALQIDGLRISSKNGGLSEEERELIRCNQVGRKKDFVYIERIDGKPTNVLQGLELYTRVFNAEEQKEIVDYVYRLQRLGRNGELKRRTYLEPSKWKRGKGRVTIQFGCCYDYGDRKRGRPPGIVRDEDVDPLPPLFKEMIKKMVRWHILPPTCVPDSCIVNIYDEGDCIPPHIDHHDFVRPFCTVSFLAECNILFGSLLESLAPGEFSGPVSLPLPVGSVLILNGNGADIAKHCVPSVPATRISITFRKMDEKKRPHKFSPDPELSDIKPLRYSRLTKSSVPQIDKDQRTSVNSSFIKAVVHQAQQQNEKLVEGNSKTAETTNSAFNIKEDFPALAVTNPVKRTGAGLSYVNRARASGGRLRQ